MATRTAYQNRWKLQSYHPTKANYVTRRATTLFGSDKWGQPLWKDSQYMWEFNNDAKWVFNKIAEQAGKDYYFAVDAAPATSSSAVSTPSGSSGSVVSTALTGKSSDGTPVPLYNQPWVWVVGGVVVLGGSYAITKMMKPAPARGKAKKSR